MSRSLFARLDERFGQPIDPLTRRSFLAATLALGVGGLVSCRSTPRTSAAGGKRVIVIGAGFAGLMCAHELKAVGYSVQVLDARERVGGRVLSFRDLVPGGTVEGGGELIGSNHPTWAACRAKFGLEFLEIKEDENLDAPLLLDGKLLTPKEAEALYEEMDGVLKLMTADAANVDAESPWLTPNATALDKKSTAEWLAKVECSPMCTRALRMQFESDNGNALHKQSYLGNLAQVKGGGLEHYWTDSETHRCKGGNQLLAFKLAKAIGEKNIALKIQVKSIKDRGDKMIISTAGGQTLEADDVVLAISPGVWNKIEFSQGLIPQGLAPQMGVNVKFLAGVKGRFWVQGGLSPDAATDGDIGSTWDATDGQAIAPSNGKDGKPAATACLTAFSGGPAAERILARKTGPLVEAYVNELAKLYPGIRENFVAGRFMDWPSEIWTGGSYSFPAPGQVTAQGPLMAKPSGGLHFAGEHTCYKFVGYMEGALDSGARVAQHIASRDGVAS
ncbi:MAG: NAD(P)/FAD-dependent oxidoreductase [Planctomycetota bacterium]